MEGAPHYGTPEPYYRVYRDLLAERIDRELEYYQPNPSDPIDELRIHLHHLPELFDIAVHHLYDASVEESRKPQLLSVIAYTIAPDDLVPDTIPLQGLLDDLLALGICLDRFYKDGPPGSERKDLTGWVDDPDGRVLAAHLASLSNKLVDSLPEELLITLHSMFGHYPQP